eukprot:gene5805-7407_t
MMLLAECVRATQGSSANWICGLAEGWAAPFHALGARGFTSGLVNVAPERSLAIWKALEANDYDRARHLVDEIAGFETLRTKYGNGANVTVVKGALGLLGTNVGPVRLPGLPELNESERAELRKIVGNVDARHKGEHDGEACHDHGLEHQEFEETPMSHPRKTPDTLRSKRWFGASDLRSFGHRSRALQMGLNHDEFMGKPVIGILNTWSEINPCHTHLRDRAEAVKRAVWAAGGFPVEIPVMSASEQYQKPTTMLYRNFLAMEAEESIRSHPLDGAVLLGGCDKSTPALIMGACSAGLPFIFVPAGPMLRGNWAGKTLGSGADVWKYWAEKEAGNISDADWRDMESGIARSHGTCMVMGTASTVACMTEALGMCLPGAGTVPATHADRIRAAEASGAAAIRLARGGMTPAKIMAKAALTDALTVLQAIGGSTNAVIHLKAIAGRIGIDLELEDWTRVGRGTPTIVDLQPSGRFLMEEFYYAGGLPAVLRRLGEADLLPHKDALTVNGKSLWENNQDAPIYNDEVVRPLTNPLIADGGICILRGNLSPRGA